MEDLRDDPIIESIMRTGYPWWMLDDEYEEEENS